MTKMADIEWIRVLGAARQGEHGPLVDWLRSDRPLSLPMRAELADALQRRGRGRPADSVVHGLANRTAKKLARDEAQRNSPMSKAIEEYRSRRSRRGEAGKRLEKIANKHGVELEPLVNKLRKGQAK
jgi:hypothetical protein